MIEQGFLLGTLFLANKQRKLVKSHFSPISLSLGLFSWIRKPLYSYRYSGWEKNEARNLANTASSLISVFRQIH